jgi:hypothetical protein
MYQGNLKATKVTLYIQLQGLLGNIIKIQAREFEVLRRQWAQYPGAVVARWKAPRKRQWSSYSEGYKPYLVVLKGWGHPDPCSPWKTIGENVQQAHHSPFSDGWNNDFDEWLEDYLASNPKTRILGDYRHTKGCSGYDSTQKVEFENHQAESIQAQLEAVGVPHNLAVDVADFYLHKSANWAAGVLEKEGFDSTVVSGKTRPEALYVNGQTIEPEDFFSQAA